MKELTLITQKDKPTHKTHNMGSGGHTTWGETTWGETTWETQHGETTWTTWGERGKDTHTIFESRDIERSVGGKGL